MSWSLPKLPGYTFSDINQVNHHVPQKIYYKNGIPDVRVDKSKVGGGWMDSESSAFIDIKNDNEIDYSLTYGKPREDIPPAPKPHWVLYDKKYLIFYGHFNHHFPDTPPEDDVTRKIKIIYYLEDDTMEIMEPAEENSGFMQGRMIKRRKIYSDYTGKDWHWKDLNVGIDRNIGGIELHISSCDGYTKAFMRSQGIELCPDEIDPESVEKIDRSDSTKFYKCGARRYPDDNPIVLQFDAIWDDTKSEYGELRDHKILFYPHDNTIAIKECHVKNGGRDPFPMLLRRAKIPKNWNKKSVNSTLFGDSTDVNDEFYEPKDLIVGESIDVLGRKFYLFDCDESTRKYYKDTLNIEQRSPVPYISPMTKRANAQLQERINRRDSKDIPSPTLHEKAKVENIVQYNLNPDKLLRYVCDMISIYPQNENRRFIMWFNLHDQTIRMDELPSKNSGTPALRFCEAKKFNIPGQFLQCYSAEHFYIGAIIYVNNHKFRIVDADISVYNYMKENPEKFPANVIENVKNHHLKYRHKMFEDYELNAKPDDDIFVCPPPREPWKTTELPASLQGLDVAMEMPEGSEQKNESQSVVCLTGPVPDTHDGNEPQLNYEPDHEYNEGQQTEVPVKKVSFQDVSNILN